MSRHTSLIVVLGLSALAGLAAPSNAASLTAISDACKSTPDCTSSEPDKDGSIIYKIRENGFLLYMECGTDGVCMRLQPKSKGSRIADPVKFIVE